MSATGHIDASDHDASAARSDELIAAIAAGDAQAWDELVRRHAPLMYRIAQRLVGDRHLAEDACQEAFLAIRDGSRRFHATGDDPDAAARAWIMRATCFASSTIRRAHRARLRRDRHVALGAPMTDISASDAAQADPAQARRLRDELERLKPALREPIVLVYLAGHSQERAASMLDISVGNLRVRLHRGLERLRRALSRDDRQFDGRALGAALALAGPEAGPDLLQRLCGLSSSPLRADRATTSALDREPSLMTKLSLAAAVGVALAGSALFMNRAPAADPAVEPAPIPVAAATTPYPTRVSVVSDRVPDVSSMDAWKRSYIRDDMSDEEKSLAIWKTVWTYQHQDQPPVEYLQHEAIVYDAIKVFNVYGYAMCGNAAAHQASLARHIGLDARGWGINAHAVAEIRWNDAWHMLDPSLINYFPKADGTIAGVDELTRDIQAWLGEHPEVSNGSGGGDDAKLREMHAAGGWQGFRAGPAILALCPTLSDRGWYPAKTHGWYATMQEYDGRGGGAGGKQFLYEYGPSEGYQVNIRLRPGERIVRNWSNKGLHVNMRPDNAYGGPGCLDAKIGEGALAYSAANGDLANGRVGNGTHTWVVPLADGLFRSAWSIDNVAYASNDGIAPAVRAAIPARDAAIVLRMASSYVYLSGSATLKAVVGAGGAVAVQLSDNNGLDWRDVATVVESGERAIDLAPWCFRRYDYLLRLTLRGAGTGVDALTLHHDIQHSQRALPALGQGDNTLTFSSGVEDTITVEAAAVDGAAGNQVTVADTHATLVGMTERMSLDHGEGSVTVPIRVPADMVRLRFGAAYRTWSDRDAWDYAVSFDHGETFRPVCEAPRRMAGCSHYVTVDDIPAGTRAALVRFTGTVAAATMLLSYRVDADYVAAGAGSAPVKVTYAWEEAGQERTHAHVAMTPGESWTIACPGKPTMRSIALELAP